MRQHKKHIFLILLSLVSLLAFSMLFAACGSKTYTVRIADYDTTQGTVTISPESEDGKYSEGTEITVTVTPNTGYELDTFKLSTEDLASTPNNDGKFVFKVQQDTTITVTFKSTFIPVTGIELGETELELEVGGKTESAIATLVATVHPDNATDKTVLWTSDHPEIATVDGGTVTAVAVGEATITAKAGEFSATCTVTVSQHQHSFGAWQDEVPATCVATGIKAHKQCTLCEKNFDNKDKEILDITIPIDANAHHLVDKVGEEGHWQGCDNPGCEYKTNVTGHNFNGALVSKGESGHATKCSIANCPYESAVTAHTLKINSDKTKFECEQCDYEEAHTHDLKLQNAGETGHKSVCQTDGCGYESAVTAHTVEAGADWQTDEQNTKHFKLCECGAHVDESEHFASSWEYDKGDMTSGKHYQMCEECYKKFNEASHVSSAKPVAGTNGHHYSCTTCPFVGADEPHTNPDPQGKCTADEIIQNGHYYICSGCEAKVSENHSMHYDGSKPDGLHMVCDKCNYDALQDAHQLSLVQSDATHHHYECTYQSHKNLGCNYKTDSVLCTDAEEAGVKTVTWTADADNPKNGHTGKCKCGNEFALEAHDKNGAEGACSKCGYKETVEHVCADNPNNGFYDGICDICHKIVNDFWTFDKATKTIKNYNGDALKVAVPSAINVDDSEIAVVAISAETTAGNKGFRANTKITDVIVPASITKLENHTFNGCTALVSAVILANVDTLPQQCFHGCKALASLVLSNTITSIQYRAFGLTAKNCTTVLKTIYFVGSQSEWDAIKNDLTETPGKTVLDGVENVYFFSNTRQTGMWHWQNGAENMIPELWS